MAVGEFRRVLAVPRQAKDARGAGCDGELGPSNRVQRTSARTRCLVDTRRHVFYYL